MSDRIPPSVRADRGRRTRRPTGNDRERAILATAERLLEVRGIHDISVYDLARGAGISRPTFYFYFPSKEAVVLSLLDRMAEEARTTRGEALEGVGDDPAQLWRAGIAAIYNTFRSHSAVTLAVAQLLPESDEVRKLWASVMEGFVDDTASAIEAERQRGVALSGIAPRELAIALNWMNERVFYASLTRQEPSIREGHILDVVLRIWSRAIYGDDRLSGGGDGV